MNDAKTILQDEADFADAQYKPLLDVDLSLNPVLLERYKDSRWYYRYEYKMGQFLGDVTGKKLLDLGCGSGQEVVYFASQGAEVTAVDISPVGIEVTKRRAAWNDVKVDAHVMACPTTLPSGSFDIVHGVGVLHHVGLDTAMTETTRLLKPGGIAVFYEPMGNSRVLEALKAWLHRRLVRGMQLTNVTEHETVMQWRELLKYSQNFAEFQLLPANLFYRIRKVFPRPIWSTLARVDHWSLRIAPFLRHFAGAVVVFLAKQVVPDSVEQIKMQAFD